jgi:chromosome segregation ATPase
MDVNKKYDHQNDLKTDDKYLNQKSLTSNKEDQMTVKQNESLRGESLIGEDNTDCGKRIKDLEERMQQQRDRFKKLKEKYEKELDEKDDKLDELEEKLHEKDEEIKEQEKQYNVLNAKYVKLKANFEEISRELDEKLERIGIKSIHKKMKDKPKENPLEIIIKMKEKEIRNTVQLMEVLRKNNEQLNKNLDNYTNVNFIAELQNKLNMKEKENQELLVEIKTLNRGLEEHKRCIKKKKEGDEEHKSLKDDLIKAKEANRELKDKLREEVAKHTKTKDSLIGLKREKDESKRHKNLNISDTDAVKKLYSNIEFDKKKATSFNHDPGVQSMYNEDSPVVETTTLKHKETNLNSSLTKDTSPINGTATQKDEIEVLQKKIETLEKSKQSIENKLKTEIKLLTKKSQQQEDRIEYLTNQFKESEQKNKILQYQSNEYKNEKKVYQRKINELQALVDKLTNSLKEREQENNILTGQLKELKKITKHNAVPPMNDKKNEETLLYLTEIKKVSFTEDVSEIKEDEHKDTQKEDESYEPSVIIS